MCGIVYSRNFHGRSVNRTIAKRYKDQRLRGYNGFGYYVPETNRLTHNVRESRILSLLKREKAASEILFHHRFPTSTENVRNACHPFSTKDVFENNYIVVHNGVVRNPKDLKKEHDNLGIKYVSEQKDGRFNDSEALAFDIARYLEGDVDGISAEGSIAFIAIKRDRLGKPMTLFFGRNTGNPLKMKKTTNSITLSSEGEGKLIDPNVLYSLSYDTDEISERDLVIPTGYTTYNHNNWYGNKNNTHRTPVGTCGYGEGSSNWTAADEARINEVLAEQSKYDEDWPLVREYDEYGLEVNQPVIDSGIYTPKEINDLYEQVLHENEGDVMDAIQMIDNLVLQLQMKQIELEETQAHDSTAAVNEYCEADEAIGLYKIVVDKLRKELVNLSQDSQGQMGFHYTPDSGVKGIEDGTSRTPQPKVQAA